MGCHLLSQASYLFCLFRTTKLKYIHILTDEISVENKQARQVSQSDTCPPRFDIELNLIILKFTGPFCLQNFELSQI
jgi:hypothetical protein